jgi:hypothetical protein
MNSTKNNIQKIIEQEREKVKHIDPAVEILRWHRKENGKLQWDLKSKEEKQAHSQRTKDQFKNRSKEEKKRITSQQSKKMKKIAAKRDPSHYLDKDQSFRKNPEYIKKMQTAFNIKCAIKPAGSNKWQYFDSFTIASEHFNMPHWAGRPKVMFPEDGSVYTGTRRASKGWQFKRIID